MDFTIEEYNEEVHLTIIEETDTLEFSIEETVEELNLTIEEYHGADGAKGEKPNHQWNGTSLRFENPDDTWGNYVDLKGDKGDYGGGLMSIVAGDNITIDNTDPLNPIINAEDGGTIVTKTSDLVNDGEDGINPYISLNDIPVVDISNKAETDASNLTPTNVLSWRDALDIYSKSQVDSALALKIDKPTIDGSNADVLVKDSTVDGGVKWSNRLTTAETAITDLYIAQAKFTVTSSITNETLSTVSNLKQNNRNNLIANGVNAINITLTSTAEAKFQAIYHKLGSGTITFVAGSGVTLVLIDGTDKMEGAAEMQTAAVHRDGNKYYIQISNR